MSGKRLRSRPRVDALLHVHGEARFVDDQPAPAGMLHAAVVPSPIAHGRLKRVDISPATAIPGVTAVLTAADIPGENQIGSLIPDEPLLATDAVHYQGQPVALVIADRPETARRAAKTVTLDIDPLPAITDPREAYAAGEIIGVPRQFACGDVEGAWPRCATIIEGRCDIGGQEHVYLETQRARALVDEGETLKVWSSTQSPYAGQKTIARILGIAEHRVEVDVKRIGGGFGGKEDQATPWACLAALGAWRTGHPVELVLDRAEDLLMTGKRHPYSSDFKMGVDGNGRILAFEVRHYQNAGAAADLSGPVLERTLFHSTNSYVVPNARIFGVSCRTNIPPSTAFRGFGGPQGMFVIESALANVADVTGIPRETLQRRNLLRTGDAFPYGQVIRRSRNRATWQALYREFDVRGTARRIDRFNRTSKTVKKGWAIMPICFGISFTATFMNQAGALVHVYTDGSVHISTGGIEMGQGLTTNLAEVAATVLGIAPGRVRVDSTNTTRVANMSPSAASATTLLNGNAVRLAAETILSRLRAVAAGEVKALSPSDITIREERIFDRQRDTRMTWSELVRSAYFQRVDLSAHGFYATPGIHFDKSSETGRPFADYARGAALVEVTLDALRGRYTIDAVRIAHDLGRPINRLVDRGQVEGGLAQGLGWMTVEELVWDSDGRLRSNALSTYKVPDVYFTPDVIDIHFLEDAPSRVGPFGSKAVGEPPLLYGIAAFFALRRAMQAYRPGRDFPFVAPLTPERVLLNLFDDPLPDASAAPPHPTEATR